MSFLHGLSRLAAASLTFTASLLWTAPAAAQQGLLGEYYNTAGLNGLVQTRVDPTIDFTTWGTSPTGTLVTPDGSYSERWTGFVFIPQAGSWDFSTVSDDGVRLRVSGNLIIDNWTNHTATLDVGSLTLSPGWHPIELEHYQAGGGVVIQLFFAGPGQPEVIIPTAFLSLTGQGNTPPTVDAGQDAVLQEGVGSTQLVGTASDIDGGPPTVVWSQESGPAVFIQNPDQLSTLVTGFSSIGPYRFRLTATDDDGAVAVDDVTITVSFTGTNGSTVSGINRVWHTITVDFPGAVYFEGANPNPFLDRRLEVTFTHVPSGETVVVPGYFAADGDAAETSATAGNVWRAHLTPARPGAWTYQASFRSGTGIAVDETMVGDPVDFHGDQGEFEIQPADPTAPGFLGSGRLEYVGEHYMVHAQTRRPFFKVGANSPENFLAYEGFDQTPASHAYQPHVADWNPGDPVWGDDEGKGIIGALNYLASEGINSVYFLTFNDEGDGDDVWPWTSETQRLRFDCSKLDQWEIVFQHMDRLGLMMHVVTQETENDTGFEGLDFGGLGQERKLYYRELIARFAHHPALVWNLGEENTNSIADLASFHDYFQAHDAYGHLLVVHTYPDSMDDVYGPMLSQGKLQGASLQVQDVNLTYDRTLSWRTQSAAQGLKWVVSMDEHGPPSEGVIPDSNDMQHNEVRRYGLWANMMAGGAGCEWYFGFLFANDDLDCEDWRSRDRMWDMSRYAKEFFEQLADPRRMAPADDLISGFQGRCLAWPGRDYAIFLPLGGSTTLDLESSNRRYRVRWFDPRLGGEGQIGSVETIKGPGVQDLGSPPYDLGQDWAVRVESIRRPVFRERDEPNVDTGFTANPGG